MIEILSCDKAPELLLSKNLRKEPGENVMVVGTAGSGKTRNFVIPNLMHGIGSYLVVDAGGYIMDATRKQMEEMGYQVKVFDIRPQHTESEKYNPFFYLKDESDVYSLAKAITDNIVIETGYRFAENQYAREILYTLFCTCISYLWEFGDAAEQNLATVGNLIKMSLIHTHGEETSFDKLLHGKAVLDNGKYTELTDEGKVEERAEQIKISKTWKNYKTYKNGITRVLSEFLVTISDSLLSNQVVTEQMLTDTIDLDSFIKTKTVLYLAIPQAVKDNNFVVAAIYCQLIKLLRGQKKDSLPVCLMMDEFACCKIPDFDYSLAVQRPKNLSICITLQSILQLKSMYTDSIETFDSLFPTKVCLNASDNATAKYFSDRAGSIKVNTGLLGRELSTRALVSPEEVTAMKPNECLILQRGETAVFDERYCLY